VIKDYPELQKDRHAITTHLGHLMGKFREGYPLGVLELKLVNYYDKIVIYGLEHARR
jgi:hypothetical protein